MSCLAGHQASQWSSRKTAVHCTRAPSCVCDSCRSGLDLSKRMIADFDVSLDCKLGYLSVQLALYGFMIESLFDVKVKETVGVFCHQSGTSEFSFDRVER